MSFNDDYVGFTSELEKLDIERSTYLFNANNVTTASGVDCIHLDEEQHLILGEAIAKAVMELGLVKIPDGSTDA